MYICLYNILYWGRLVLNRMKLIIISQRDNCKLR
ncbi:hypothetical protein Phi14:2_gp012 [Cellulophaga phage phi14:2]|uniref:Uncharacterized protein n=1 Tax=Cellulophaga phage phi14:2 TaxID=1327990 RepID=S0A260_9CAUD|nr:hypothetical protein Phi14:2_gp012 [Cellulophaga phage phi14:2]